MVGWHLAARGKPRSRSSRTLEQPNLGFDPSRLPASLLIRCSRFDLVLAFGAGTREVVLDP